MTPTPTPDPTRQHEQLGTDGERFQPEHGEDSAACQMAQSGGLEDITSAGESIINTSSVQASSPSPGLLDCATTKAGIADFTRGLAMWLGERGSRVDSVAPGPIWTPLIPATMPTAMVEVFGRDTPLNRAGQPAELAPAYVVLASATASFSTGGEVLAVTDGQPVPVQPSTDPLLRGRPSSGRCGGGRG